MKLGKLHCLIGRVGLALGIAWDVRWVAGLWQVPKAWARISPVAVRWGVEG